MKEVRPITPKPIIKNPIAHRRIKLFTVIKVPKDINPTNPRIQMAVIPANIIKITDRKEAIKIATLLAKKGDIILIAGKGHETYQEINDVRIHFDDKEIVTEMLKSMTN